MASAPVPSHVVRFISEHIHSVEQLEILLLMRARGGEWTPTAVADELRISALSTQARLRDLAARGFLKAEAEGTAFRYEPNDESISQVIGDLAASYALFRVRIIELIFSVPRGLGSEEANARSLAEAFRIRKKTGPD